MLITYLASGDEEVVACELSAFRFAMRSVRPRMHSFRGKWPAEWQTGPEHPTCQVVWRDEPLLLAPGCAEPFWIDAPLAAAVADASIRLMGRSDPHAVRVITVCGDQIVEHIIAGRPPGARPATRPLSRTIRLPGARATPRPPAGPCAAGARAPRP